MQTSTGLQHCQTTFWIPVCETHLEVDFEYRRTKNNAFSAFSVMTRDKLSNMEKENYEQQHQFFALWLYCSSIYLEVKAIV